MRQLGECSAWCFADQRGRSQRQPDSDQTLGLSDSQTHMQTQAQAQAPQMPKGQPRCLVSFLHAKKTHACVLLTPPRSTFSLLFLSPHHLLTLVVIPRNITGRHYPCHIHIVPFSSFRPAAFCFCFVRSAAPCQTQAKMGQSSQTPASATKRRLASNRHPIFLALIDERSAPP